MKIETSFIESPDTCRQLIVEFGTISDEMAAVLFTDARRVPPILRLRMLFYHDISDQDVAQRTTKRSGDKQQRQTHRFSAKRFKWGIKNI